MKFQEGIRMSRHLRLLALLLFLPFVSALACDCPRAAAIERYYETSRLAVRARVLAGFERHKVVLLGADWMAVGWGTLAELDTEVVYKGQAGSSFLVSLPYVSPLQPVYCGWCPDSIILRAGSQMIPNTRRMFFLKETTGIPAMSQCSYSPLAEAKMETAAGTVTEAASSSANGSRAGALILEVPGAASSALGVIDLLGRPRPPSWSLGGTPHYWRISPNEVVVDLRSNVHAFVSHPGKALSRGSEHRARALAARLAPEIQVRKIYLARGELEWNRVLEALKNLGESEETEPPAPETTSSVQPQTLDAEAEEAEALYRHMLPNLILRDSSWLGTERR